MSHPGEVTHSHTEFGLVLALIGKVLEPAWLFDPNTAKSALAECGGDKDAGQAMAERRPRNLCNHMPRDLHESRHSHP
ncbi:MAG: hypothetical protein WAT64_00560 [Dokdonella sp.]